MAKVTITLTDEEVDGVAKVRFQKTIIEPMPAGTGELSRALLVANEFTHQFEAGKINLDDTMRRIRGEYAVQQAVKNAAASEG